MNLASVVVVIGLFALVGFALWRNFRKGVPCSCGCSDRDCACCSERHVTPSEKSDALRISKSKQG